MRCWLGHQQGWLNGFRKEWNNIRSNNKKVKKLQGTAYHHLDVLFKHLTMWEPPHQGQKLVVTYVLNLKILHGSQHLYPKYQKNCGRPHSWFPCQSFLRQTSRWCAWEYPQIHLKLFPWVLIFSSTISTMISPTFSMVISNWLVFLSSVVFLTFSSMLLSPTISPTFS